MSTLREFVDRYWVGFLETSPVYATTVGVADFDDQLPDLTEAGRAKKETLNRWALAELEKHDRAALDFETRTALDVVEAIARRELSFLEHRFDLFWAASHFAGGQWFGPGYLPGVLAEVQTVRSDLDAQNYLARVRRIPAYLDASCQLVDEGARMKQTMPAPVVDRTIAQVGRMLATPPHEWELLAPLGDSHPDERRRMVDAVDTTIRAAYGVYLETLQRYRAAAREPVGLCALDRGEELYAAEIEGWTSLPIDARELHRIGVEGQALVQEERETVARRLGYASADAASNALDTLETNQLGTRRQVMDLVEEQARRSWDAASRFFGRLPRGNVVVRPIDPSREDDTLDYYTVPSSDSSRPGVFYVSSKPRARHSMATTTYHEANPGHHFQISLEVEAEGRQAIRRGSSELIGAAFGEGWGLYSERLADEMGLYVDDAERLGMLEMQALRAARLVVDTGLHALGWDRERAVATLETTGWPRWKAELEIDRYLAMPGQALCYRVGQREIEKLRAEATAREGPGFSLSSFHDRMLAMGSLPLATLRREMETARSS